MSYFIIFFFLCLLDYDIVITTFIDRKGCQSSHAILHDKEEGRKEDLERQSTSSLSRELRVKMFSSSALVLRSKQGVEQTTTTHSCILHQVSKVELIMMDLADALRQMLLVHSKCIAKLISKIEFYVNVRKSLKKSHIQIFSMNHFCHKNQSI